MDIQRRPLQTKPNLLFLQDFTQYQKSIKHGLPLTSYGRCLPINIMNLQYSVQPLVKLALSPALSGIFLH